MPIFSTSFYQPEQKVDEYRLKLQDALTQCQSQDEREAILR